MTDGIGTTQYRYRSVGGLGALQLDTLDGPWSNDAIAYAYDSLGRMQSVSINGSLAKVAYDSLGRVATDSNALGTFTYAYVAQSSRVDSIFYPNGQKTGFAYYSNSEDLRLKTIRHLKPSGQILSAFDYAYDAEGQIQQWTRQADADTPSVYTFQYDNVDQLTSAVLHRSIGTGPVMGAFSYVYDKSGNRLSAQRDSLVQQASFNSLNQLISSQGGGKMRFEGNLDEAGTVSLNGHAVEVSAGNAFTGMVDVATDSNIVSILAQDYSGNQRTRQYRVVVPGMGSKAYTYDANGNMTGDGTRIFEWDAEDRLLAVVNGSQRSEFAYDGLGRRIQITEKSGSSTLSKKRLLWVGNAIAQERDSTGASVVKQYFGNGMKTGTGKYFYARDHLESVREMTDSVGALVARYDYDPYGVQTKVSGSGEADFGFTGHYVHGPSSLYLTKYRVYSAGLGRWISRDPMGEKAGLNLYSYVKNNVVYLVDPFGLDSKDIRKCYDECHEEAERNYKDCKEYHLTKIELARCYTRVWLGRSQCMEECRNPPPRDPPPEGGGSCKDEKPYAM